MRTFKSAVLLAAMLAASQGAFADVVVGGQAMLASRDIIDNAVNSADHTTLVAAVKAAGLVDTLKGSGPFTVFAPTNASFAKLPAGTVDSLLKPANKGQLTNILTYHVVAGKYDFKALREAIEKQHGTATLHAVNGGTLTLAMNGTNNITVADSQGHRANISTYDVLQSNGVINVIDAVLMP